MKILFDQGTPVPLRDGELLALAETAAFDLFVTTNQNLRNQQNLSNRRIAMLVLPTTRWPQIHKHAADVSCSRRIDYSGRLPGIGMVGTLSAESVFSC